MTEYDSCVKRCTRRNFDARTTALFKLAAREFPQLKQSKLNILLKGYDTKAGTELKEVISGLCSCQCSDKPDAPIPEASCPTGKPATELAKLLSTQSVQNILKGKEAMAALAKEVSPVRVEAGKKAARTRAARMKAGTGREIWVTLRLGARFKKGTIRRQDIGAKGGAYRTAGILKTGGWKTHQFIVQKYDEAGVLQYRVDAGNIVPITPRAEKEWASIAKRFSPSTLEHTEGDFFKAKEHQVLERDKPTPAQKAALQKARTAWMEMSPEERAKRMPGGK